MQVGDYYDVLMMPMMSMGATMRLRIQPGEFTGYAVMHCHRQAPTIKHCHRTSCSTAQHSTALHVCTTAWLHVPPTPHPCPPPLSRFAASSTRMLAA